MMRKIRRLCLAFISAVTLILSATLTQPTLGSALLTGQSNIQSAPGVDTSAMKHGSSENQPAFQVAEATQIPATVAIETQEQKPPNFVLILVDDSGLMDFGAFGGEANTPNLDQLAQNGTWFNNFHTSPVCAPSRAMLIAGSDSHLTGVANLPEMLPEGYADQPGYAGELNESVNTVATRLKAAGYETYATGKWHLGHSEELWLFLVYSEPRRKGVSYWNQLTSSGIHHEYRLS